MNEFSDQLEEIMTSRNFFIKGKINYNLTGKFQRFPNASVYKRSKDLFVVLHDYDRGATFGDWNYPDDWFTYWNKKYENPNLSELKIRKKVMEANKAAEAYERSKREWRSKEFWHKYYLNHDPTTHPYVIKKCIFPYYAKCYRTKLFIPVSDIDFNLKTLQIIKPDGFKRLWKGTSQRNLMMWLCQKLSQNYDGIIRVCEGYATGCTIKHITKSPVVCGINSLNMIKVCIELKRKFIHAQIKICADNDKWGRENTGLKHATQAAKFINAPIYYPIFESNNNREPTDFNDLYVLHGAQEVKRQLLMARD
jgi:putative DNA primase/helicase